MYLYLYKLYCFQMTVSDDRHIACKLVYEKYTHFGKFQLFIYINIQ